MSLVTPDSLRTIRSNGANERDMLRDQVKAMRRLEKKTEIELDGKIIPVKLKLNTFNFGVNAGAVGKFKLLGIKLSSRFLRVGLSKQYKYNQKALKELQRQFLAFKTDDEEVGKKTKSLMDDINRLMEDKHAYLAGDNQYEIGAKILNLTHLIDQEYKKVNKNQANVPLQGFKAAFNCMSGKDRTGLMDCVAKTFAVMADLNGAYPDHDQFKGKEGEATRKQFTAIFVPMLLESGSLEVTRTNTGAMGYKVNEEARLFGMDLDKFLQAQGLAVTTAS